MPKSAEVVISQRFISQIKYCFTVFANDFRVKYGSSFPKQIKQFNGLSTVAESYRSRWVRDNVDIGRIFLDIEKFITTDLAECSGNFVYDYVLRARLITTFNNCLLIRNTVHPEEDYNANVRPYASRVEGIIRLLHNQVAEKNGALVKILNTPLVDLTPEEHARSLLVAQLIDHIEEQHTTANIRKKSRLQRLRSGADVNTETASLATTGTLGSEVKEEREESEVKAGEKDKKKPTTPRAIRSQNPDGPLLEPPASASPGGVFEGMRVVCNAPEQTPAEVGPDAVSGMISSSPITRGSGLPLFFPEKNSEKKGLVSGKEKRTGYGCGPCCSIL